MNSEEFHLRVAQSLAGCQLVEQELKLYITEALLLVKKRLDGSMPFKMAGENYENYSLGRLIEVFQKLSDNEQLVVDLKAFTEQRNFLSHKAIAVCLDFEGRVDESLAAEMQGILLLIESDAERLRHAIHAEGNKISVQLAFEKIE